MPYTPADKDEQAEYYEKVMRLYDGHCVVCYPDNDLTGVTVHEIDSRAHNPYTWWKNLLNGCPLCQVHHDYVHSLPSAKREEYCRIHMKKAIIALGRK